MNVFKKLTTDEYLALEHGREGSIYLERGDDGLKYTPETSNFWGKDKHAFTYFVCLGEPKLVALYKTASGRDSKQKVLKVPVLGIAELEVNPYNKDEVWLKYVSVHAKNHGQGIGRQLGKMIAEHMATSSANLRRSFASDLSLSGGFQSYMDRILDEAGVMWTQSGRDDSYSMF